MILCVEEEGKESREAFDVWEKESRDGIVGEGRLDLLANQAAERLAAMR